MKQLHIHVASENLDDSRKFYSALFNAEPNKTEIDYLEWLLPEQQVMFSVSKGEQAGLRSLGMLFDNEDSLEKEHQRLNQHFSIEEFESSGCCHAKTKTFWLKNEKNVPWMFFQKTGAFKGLGAVAPVGVESQPQVEAKTSCCN
jgi:hypothetical protein